MWQMTWDELGKEDVKPIAQNNPSGSVYYRCGICGAPVGIYGPKGWHEEGWLHKKDKCENGHVIDWKGEQGCE